MPTECRGKFGRVRPSSGFTKKGTNMITTGQLKELFDYDPLTGTLLWSKGRGGKKRGDIAGGISRGSPVVCIDGTNYPARDIIWQMVKGRRPTKQVRFINKINTDLRWENLTLYKKKTSMARVDIGIERTPYGIHLISTTTPEPVDLGTYKDIEEAIAVLRILL